jgi:hypothetical protein
MNSFSSDDFRRLAQDAEIYSQEVADSQFALSCFGSLMPYLPDFINNTIVAMRDNCGFQSRTGEGVVAPLSNSADCNRLVAFDTERFKSASLSLLIEGSTKGLKGSGAEHQQSHLRRMMAGYVIGSQIAENANATPWVLGDKIVTLGLPELTAVFNIYSSGHEPKSNQLEQVLEDQSIANHYRFAASAAIFTLSCSLASMGALGGNILAVAERISRRMRNPAQLNSRRILEEALANERSAYTWDDTEAGLTIAALGSAFSAPDMFNAMTHFIQTGS